MGIEDLPKEFLVEGFFVNVQFLEMKADITAGAYVLSIVEIVSNVQQFGSGALVMVNNCILDRIWGNDSTYLFDSYSKENCIGSVYYNASPFKRQPHKIAKRTQTIRWLLTTNCLSVFNYSVGFALKG